MQLVTVSKPSDLINCIPISRQITDIDKDGKSSGYNKVAGHILNALSETFLSIGCECTAKQLKLFTDDLMDKYRLDSIEDILECLKNGRQGNYGNNYGKLNMIVITDWMDQHLESKYREREKKEQNEKKKNASEIPTIDYKAYRERLERERNDVPGKREKYITPEEIQRELKKYKPKT